MTKNLNRNQSSKNLNLPTLLHGWPFGVCNPILTEENGKTSVSVQPPDDHKAYQNSKITQLFSQSLLGSISGMSCWTFKS